MMNYRVRPGCYITHEGKEYKSGQSLELTEVQALVHNGNIEVATNDQPPVDEQANKQPETIKEILEAQKATSEIDLLPTEAGTHQPIAGPVEETPSPVEVPPPPIETETKTKSTK